MNLKLGQTVAWIDPVKNYSGIYLIQDIEGIGFDAILVIDNKKGDAFEATEKQLFDPEDILVCKQCGDFHMRVKAWTDLNTNEYIEDAEPAGYWCNECNQSTTPIPANVFYFSEIEELES
jgi:hypothetical protein